MFNIDKNLFKIPASYECLKCQWGNFVSFSKPFFFLSKDDLNSPQPPHESATRLFHQLLTVLKGSQHISTVGHFKYLRERSKLIGITSTFQRAQLSLKAAIWLLLLFFHLIHLNCRVAEQTDRIYCVTVWMHRSPAVENVTYVCAACTVQAHSVWSAPHTRCTSVKSLFNISID